MNGHPTVLRRPIHLSVMLPYITMQLVPTCLCLCMAAYSQQLRWCEPTHLGLSNKLPAHIMTITTLFAFCHCSKLLHIQDQSVMGSE